MVNGGPIRIVSAIVLNLLYVSMFYDVCIKMKLSDDALLRKMGLFQKAMGLIKQCLTEPRRRRVETEFYAFLDSLTIYYV